MAKQSVYLAQISTPYGSGAFLPYSAGCVWAYARTCPEIDATYDLKGFLVHRESVDAVVNRLEQPSVLGVSAYIWNWRYSLALAQSVKAAHPDCHIIFGGPHIPDDATGFFVDYPFIDFLVHGEGEVTFAALLQARLPGHMGRQLPLGVSAQGFNHATIQMPARERLSDLSVLPSPYTTGLFDELMQEDRDWLPVVETNRGCPYSCTFCEWGSATQTKTKMFPMERLQAEIAWFSQHHTRFLTNADANFGIMPRDVELTECLTQAKTTYGFPKEMHATYAKNATARVFAISKMLNDAQMCKGVTMSFQSLDVPTLQAIKRSNIKIDRYREHLAQYQAADIPTYSELILGLPGETLDSFKDGIDTLLQAGQHQGITVYLCRMLPNTEMNDPVYRQEYGIQTIQSPSTPQHSAPRQDAIQEYDELVIGTASMPPEDWRQAYLFSWAVQTFHCMGLTRLVAQYLHQAHGVTYRQFYDAVLTYAEHAYWSLLLGREYRLTQASLDRALAGGPWDVNLHVFGAVNWPLEEASFLRLVPHPRTVLRQVGTIVSRLAQHAQLTLDQAVMHDLLAYQVAMIRTPGSPRTRALGIAYDWPQYFAALASGCAEPLQEGPVQLTLDVPEAYGGNRVRFARDLPWYGRKAGNFYYTPTTKG